MSTEGHGEKVARAAENEVDAHDAVLAGITFTHKALKPQNLPSMVSKSSATQSVPQQRQQGGAGRQLVLSIGNIWTWVFNSFSNGAHPWLKFVPSNVPHDLCFRFEVIAGTYGSDWITISIN